MSNYAAGRKSTIGCNIRPGSTPGGFSKELGRSDGERNSRRHTPKSDPRYGKYKDVIQAANTLLSSNRFGP